LFEESIAHPMHKFNQKTGKGSPPKLSVSHPVNLCGSLGIGPYPVLRQILLYLLF
jgi:hypothetical protein